MPNLRQQQALACPISWLSSSCQHDAKDWRNSTRAAKFPPNPCNAPHAHSCSLALPLTQKYFSRLNTPTPAAQQKFFATTLPSFTKNALPSSSLGQRSWLLLTLITSNEIIECILELLENNGVFISESHYLLPLVETVQYDTIYYEHFRYYSLHIVI